MTQAVLLSLHFDQRNHERSEGIESALAEPDAAWIGFYFFSSDLTI